MTHQDAYRYWQTRARQAWEQTNQQLALNMWPDGLGEAPATDGKPEPVSRRTRPDAITTAPTAGSNPE